MHHIIEGSCVAAALLADCLCTGAMQGHAADKPHTRATAEWSQEHRGCDQHPPAKTEAGAHGSAGTLCDS